MAEQFSDTLKCVMLQNAVHPLEELHSIKNEADQHKTQSGTDLTFDAIKAYVTNQHAPGSRMMPFTRWQSLPQEMKDVWDSIPDTDKALILGNGSGTQAMATHGQCPARPIRATNFHGIDTATLVAYLHDVGIDTDTLGMMDTSFSTDADTTDSGDRGQMVLANATQQRKWTKPKGADLPPSDIRKVLSSVSRPEAGGTDSDEITFQGKTYCLANVVLTYTVSGALHHNSHASLIDQGANGGVTGEDVRIIERTMHSVDIQGLDNHQVTNIPIVTAGSVIHLQHGEVIIIMHQYAGIVEPKRMNDGPHPLPDRLRRLRITLERATTRLKHLFHGSSPETPWSTPTTIRNV
jgi:hypothetical protein